MPLQKLETNSSTLIIAGSETTATLLSGVTYLLLTSPDSLAKLTTEIRSAFSDDKEIDINSVNPLKYLQACLEEALRMYPPVPIGLPRIVPPGGGSISGHYVPENVSLARIKSEKSTI
jgi:cytochrome P450